MSSVFDALRYGPFEAEYHRVSVNESFRSALVAHLTRELLPQVTVGTEFFEGHLKAAYDEDRYCGPNSLVRDIYQLEVAFGRGAEKETLDKELVFTPMLQQFAPRRETQLRLWTLERQRKAKSVADLIDRVAEEHLRAAQCPICDADLLITDAPGLFGVVCPEGCFHHDRHRNPDTGEVTHGHLFVKEPE